MIQVGRVTARSGLHLRKKPDANAEVITTLPFGTVVDINHQQGNWLLIDYNFKSGYLYKDYVEVLQVSPPDRYPPYTLPLRSSKSKIMAVGVIAIVVVIFLVWWNLPFGF